MIKVISGGQTGVDRGALDAAIAVGIPHGGFKPGDGKAEDGAVPTKYDLSYHWQMGYTARTTENVRSSDATVILYRPGSPWGPGTKMTKSLCHWFKKPCVEVPLGYLTTEGSQELDAFLAAFDVINFAGSRESKCPGIQEQVRDYLIPYFKKVLNGGEE